MPETFTQVCAFCGLAGHYQHFIRGFVCMARPLYDVLGKEVKMGGAAASQGAEGGEGLEGKDPDCLGIGIPGF